MRAKQVDANHAEIVKVFRQCGFAVHDSSAAGEGFPDLVVYRPGNSVLLVEVKDGSKPPSKRKLTPAQSKFSKSFPVTMICGVEDVLKLAGQYDIPVRDMSKNNHDRSPI